MKTYEIDRPLTRCFIFICAVNILLSMMFLKSDSPSSTLAGSSTVDELTTIVCIYGLIASAYGIYMTRGAERFFSIVLGVLFAVMMNIEAHAQFLGFGIVPVTALVVVAAIVVQMARSDPRQTSLCVSQLRSFALSRNSILFAAAVLVYVVSRATGRLEGNAAAASWSWWLHQGSLLSVMVLFVYAACPYIKRHRVR
jgi:type IV secretory pathway TrbD component